MLDTGSVHHLVKGVVLGLGAAVPLGPVNVEIARRTLRGGFWAGFFLGAGAVTIDVTYAVLTTFSVGRLLHTPALVLPLSLASVALLGYLGVLCLRSAWKSFNKPPQGDLQPAPGASHLLRGYATGLAMTLLNPMTLVFWFVGLPGIAGALDERALPLICVGVFLGTISWVIFFAGTLSAVGKLKRGQWMAYADAFGGVTLLGWAGFVLLRSFRPYL